MKEAASLPLVCVLVIELFVIGLILVGRFMNQLVRHSTTSEGMLPGVLLVQGL